MTVNTGTKGNDPSGAPPTNPDQQGAGGTTDDPSGVNGKETIAYSTYKKVVNQEKNLRARLDEVSKELTAIRDKEKAEEEKRLAAQGEYKKLLDLEKKKREELEEQTKGYQASILKSQKISAFKEKLPGTIENPAYYNFADLDLIAVNPETGELDESSVQASVDKFVTEHSPLLKSAKGKLPNNAPKDGAAPLTYDQWAKLPLKEKKERMAEVMASEKQT